MLLIFMKLTKKSNLCSFRINFLYLYFQDRGFYNFLQLYLRGEFASLFLFTYILYILKHFITFQLLSLFLNVKI